MNKFVKQINKEVNKTVTENGAKSFKSTLSDCLDFYYKGGASRGKDSKTLYTLFKNAFNDDPVVAMKILFYIRDIRGGIGERQVFRSIIKSITDDTREVQEKMITNMHLIPKFGRWDDMFEFIGTPLANDMMNVIKDTLYNISVAEKDDYDDLLMYKWLPSANASSKKTKAKAAFIRYNLGMSPREYRKMLTEGRKKLNIVESLMCSKDWDEIEYSKVPSKASMNYRKAFGRNDGVRYAEYIHSVEKGETKINASTLFPYEIYTKVNASYSNDSTLEELWKALPDYVDGEHNALVMADVSGSMYSNYYGSVTPISVSVSLALYLAERNKGDFKDIFMTFSENPEFVKINGKKLKDKINNINQSNWGYNTNIQAAFKKILSMAVNKNIPQKDLPEVMFIISDMQFDKCERNRTNFKAIKKQYKQSGYEMPKLVFWNVNSREGDIPVTMNQDGVYLVSGCSPTVFKSALKSTSFNPVDFMMETLNNERYSVIV